MDFVGSSIRNSGRGGRLRLLEHVLRYRSYHARARQATLLGGGELVLTYESLVEDIDSELSRLFEIICLFRPYRGDTTIDLQQNLPRCPL